MNDKGAGHLPGLYAGYIRKDRTYEKTYLC